MTKLSRKNAKNRYENRKQRMLKLNDILITLLKDLVCDLEKDKVMQESSIRLQEAIDMLGKDVYKDFTSSDDSLLRAVIPYAWLKSHKNGDAYLSSLERFKKDDIANKSDQVQELMTPGVAATGANSSAVPLIPAELQSLAEDFQKQLNLPENIEDIDIGAVMQSVTAMLDAKRDSGELDMEKLQTQTNSFLQSMQNNTQLQEMMSNPDIMSGLMGAMANSGGGMPDLSKVFGQHLQ